MRNPARSLRRKLASPAARVWWLLLSAVVLGALHAWLGELRGFHGLSVRFVVQPIIFAVYFAAVWLVFRSREGPRPNVELAVVILAAIVFRWVVFIGYGPINPDLDRHLWEGRVLVEGLNPYAAPPESAVYDDLRARLKSEGDNLYSGVWTQYAHIRSVYGPVATGLFALPHLTPWNRVATLRAIMTLFDFLTVLVLLGIAGALKWPRTAIIVYAWSPVCLDGFAQRGQVDAAMVFFVALSVLLMVKRRPAWGGVAFALAILTKVSPLLLLLPLLRVGKARFALAFTLIVILGVIPFAGAGLDGLEGFSAFAGLWQRNDSLYSVLLWLLSPLTGLADPSRIARATVAFAGLAYAFVVAVRMKPGPGRDLIHALTSISAAVILLSPVTYPWYGALLIAFLCFEPRASLLALSTAPMFWYLRFLMPSSGLFWGFVYDVHQRWRQPWRLPVYGIVGLLFLRDALQRRRASRRRDTYPWRR